MENIFFRKTLAESIKMLKNVSHGGKYWVINMVNFSYRNSSGIQEIIKLLNQEIWKRETCGRIISSHG